MPLQNGEGATLRHSNRAVKFHSLSEALGHNLNGALVRSWLKLVIHNRLNKGRSDRKLTGRNIQILSQQHGQIVTTIVVAKHGFQFVLALNSGGHELIL